MTSKKRPSRRRAAVKKRIEERPTAAKLRKVIQTALGEDQALMTEVTESLRKKAGNRLSAFPTLLQAADALEPVLGEAVSRKPSLLGRLAYGTANLLSTLAVQDEDSQKHLAELAESSHVGIVFVDLVGFTEFTATNGDEAAVKLVRRLEETVAKVCGGNRGEVIKHLGDGFLLAFPSSREAVQTAIALRDQDGLRRDDDPALPRLRIAVHAGRPTVGGDDVIGHDVNLTARLLEHCDPGEVLVTEVAVELSGRDLPEVSFKKKGPVQPRGVPESVETYSALSVG